MRALSLFVAAACLVFGWGMAARAQTLQASTIALYNGNSTTFNGYSIDVGSCMVNDGGESSAACPSSGGDLYLYPFLSRGALNLIIEAADTSGNLVPIFSCTTGGAPGDCSTGPQAYDLTVELDVSGPTSVTAVVQNLVGSASSPAPGAVYNTENVVGGGFTPTTLCSSPGFGTSLTASGSSTSSAVCSFSSSPQTSLAITKDLGLNLSGVGVGTTLSLRSIAQILTPAPEPASIAVLSAAIAALGALRQRRRRI